MRVLVVVLLAACAPLEQRPLPIPEPKVTYQSYPVPTPVPCFTEAERPVLPPPSPVDTRTATVDQLVAAIAADDLNEEVFARKVDALFLRCMKGVTP